MERIDARGIADERTAVRKWLDYHRATLAQKAGGVTEEQARVTLTAGGLTLLGLVWHLTKVERSWFGRVFLDDASVGPLYHGEAHPTGDDHAAWVHREMGTIDLRWIMLPMIEETARHNCHADLLRKVADGTTGE